MESQLISKIQAMINSDVPDSEKLDEIIKLLTDTSSFLTKQNGINGFSSLENGMINGKKSSSLSQRGVIRAQVCLIGLLNEKLKSSETEREELKEKLRKRGALRSAAPAVPSSSVTSSIAGNSSVEQNFNGFADDMPPAKKR